MWGSAFMRHDERPERRQDFKPLVVRTFPHDSAIDVKLRIPAIASEWRLW